MKRSAIVFILSCILLSSCSRKNAEELYLDAQVQEGQKNFALAAERYEEILRRFPADAKAESSQFNLALLYQNDLHDSRKAVHAYQRFHELFPQSNRAATALFLAAFLFNNDLHNYDSAKIVYETFLQKYPGHELAASAKYELSTIGTDPNALVPNQVTSTEESTKKKPRSAK